MARVSPQLICFTYHKSGTSLFYHVMTKVSRRLGLRLVNRYGLVDHLDPDPDIVLIAHSLLRTPLDWPYRAIRLIRDPRDIWVSGYLYHLRCDEEWCRNTDLDPTPPIGWPKVDYSVIHWPEDWKRGYLERLGGKSYQQNLLDRSRADGLAFELDGYTGCTLAAMREWTLNRADALDVRLEDVMDDFDATMLRIFAHFGFTAEQSQAALEVASSEDIRRMNDTAIAKRPQIHSRSISKWREVLSPAEVAQFEERHGDLIRCLGYQLAGEESDPPTTQDIAAIPGDPEIWLSADGARVLPATAGSGSYSFVVRAGTERVRLESQCDTLADAARRRGVRVREIEIRSGDVDIVVAADDPGLRAGWHEVEREGTALWRWTNGSAEVPWVGTLEPAIVTVRCFTPADRA